MSNDTITQFEPDLQPALDTIDSAAATIAQSRAQKVAQISGGAILTTTDQLASMQIVAREELITDLRERVRDVANEYVIEITNPLISGA